MEADIDFDVITHLGFIRNIDVASRGYTCHDENNNQDLDCLYVLPIVRVFFVRVTLFYGDNDQRITPIGKMMI